MNEQTVISNIEKELIPLQQVLNNASRDDLSYQTQEYGALHQLEAETVADKLNHRAQMMRLKADEFDKLADSIRKSSESICKDIHSFASQYEDVLTILDEHSHIKPKAVNP